jgi:hypothetical protein
MLKICSASFQSTYRQTDGRAEKGEGGRKRGRRQKKGKEAEKGEGGRKRGRRQ